jgi:5-methylcytosine-specific restriction endonuclease McrA
MNEFPDTVAQELLAACARRCCICQRWRGRNLEIHHIKPKSKGGKGTSENGIPVCFDCHAEIESRSNMGRGFTPAELRRHRNRWFSVVAKHPRSS